MEQGRVKAGGMEIYRFAPGAPDVLRGDEEIVYVKIPGVHGVHHAVYDVKQSLFFTPGQAGGPDALGRGKAAQVGPLRVGEDMGIQLPVLHVTGVVYRNGGEPLKAGTGDIVVVPLPADTGVGVEAGQDGIFQLLTRV